MAFKMKGYQAHGKSPMKVGGKWSNWGADKQKFIGDEIEHRRRKRDIEKGKYKLDDDGNIISTDTTDKKDDKNKKTNNTGTPTPTTTSTDNKENDNNNNNETSGRVEYIKNNPELGEVKTGEGEIVDGEYKAGDSELPGYVGAFNNMEINADGMRVNPRNNQLYPNTKAGLEQFETDSETWWKEQHEGKGQGQNLNIDSQTDKQSTHEVWD